MTICMDLIPLEATNMAMRITEVGTTITSFKLVLLLPDVACHAANDIILKGNSFNVCR
jgi:hypothetical protein